MHSMHSMHSKECAKTPRNASGRRPVRGVRQASDGHL